MLGNILANALWIFLPVAAAALTIRFWPHSDQQEFGRRLRDFWHQRRGVPLADQQAELTVRTAAARLRRRASDEAAKTPRHYSEHIKRLAKEEAMMLAAYDRTAAKEFLAWVESAPLQDILYPEAFKMVYRQIGREVAERLPTEKQLQDAMAALKVKG